LKVPYKHHKPAVPEMAKKKIWASKKLVTGPNGIMVAQTFCDILFMKKNHQISIYKQFSVFRLIVFLSITLTFCLSLVSRGWGLQGNFGRYRCAAEIAKTPKCIYCYQMKPEFTCYNLFDNLDAIG
jgi:hypothetical protein